MRQTFIFATAFLMTGFFLGEFCSAAGPDDFCECPSDTNADGVINVDDLLEVINGWGPHADHPADVNQNGFVDVDDLLAVINAWGQPCTVPGMFPTSWIHGAAQCVPQPQPLIQVHRYNADTYILRQSKCTNYEAPFIYLLFGEDKVLMQDTGASNVPLFNTVQTVINQWLAENRQQSIQLVVTHSHGHGDHAFNDSQFNGQPNAVVVGTSQTAVRNFFGISAWPTQIVQYDLGGRTIDVIPIPGHHSAHIALYDRQDGLLLTGDTLYPGRLYVQDFASYQASILRLAAFTDDKPLCHVLGTHVEMTSTPGVDYPVGTTFQPNEHVLELGREHLLELNQALIAMGNTPQYEVHDDFIIYPLGLFGLTEPPCCATKHASGATHDDDGEDQPPLLARMGAARK